MKADYIIRDAKVYRSAFSSPSDDWIIVRNGSIVDLIPAIAASSLDLQGEVLSLPGKTILPGFYDSHMHMLQYGRSLEYVDCETNTLTECLNRIRRKAESSPPDSWILGHGWDHNRWHRIGNLADLDSITTRHPVYLTSKSLHSAWGNSRAFSTAGITSLTPDPPGGVILRSGDNQLSGILLENACALIADTIPSPDEMEIQKILTTAQEKLWSFGIVGIHNFDRQDSFRGLQIMRNSGELGIRILQSVPLDALECAASAGLSSNLGDDWLRIGHVKLFMDGALGPHTAAMVSPYEQEKDNSGVLLLDQEELESILHRALKAGFPLAVHAIGDLANHTVLKVFRTGKSGGIVSTPIRSPHRIEHAQLLLQDDLKIFTATDTVASMQPVHATSDMMMAEANWGSRCELAYAWRSLLDAGVTLLFGSDAPVESPNPFSGLHAAVTRRRPDGSPGPDGWYPNQRIRLDEAIHAYTETPASFFHSPRLTGKIAPSSAADLIVLETDPFHSERHDLKDFSPIGTMVDGIWRKREF